VIRNLTQDYRDVVGESARYSLILMVAQVLSTVISALSLILIARIMGAASYGEYTIALVPASIAMLFQDLGISMAVTRYCAKCSAEGKTAELRAAIETSLLFEGITSIIISIAMYLLSPLIATTFLNMPGLTNLVQAVSLSVLGNALMSTAQGIMVGNGRMGLTSIIQIIWALARGIIGVMLVLIGLGSFGAVLSTTVAYLLAGFAGVLLLYRSVKFDNASPTYTARWNILKALLVFGFPLYIETLIAGGLSQLSNTVMTLNITTNLIGNYSATKNFGVLVAFLTVPISTVLFPLFSKFKQGDPHLKLVFREAVKYTAILIYPIVVYIILVSVPLAHFVYGDGYPYVSQYLSIFLISYLFEGFGGISIDSFILGIGESRVFLVGSVISFLIGAPLIIVLTPQFKIFGLLIAWIITPWGGRLYELIWVKRKLGFTVDIASNLKIYFSSAVAAFATYVVITQVKMGSIVTLFFSAILLFPIYLLILTFIGTITKTEIAEFDRVANSLGPLASIVKRGMKIFSRLVRS